MTKKKNSNCSGNECLHNCNNTANTKTDKVYQCGICNKLYKTIEDRMLCEAKCITARKQAEEEMKKAKLAEEKNARMEEINKMYGDLHAKIADYVKDYGHISLKSSNHDEHCPTLGSLFDFWRM